ncbi:MAG: FAD-binding oxidoreductase [Acidobacteriota bacterium]
MDSTITKLTGWGRCPVVEAPLRFGSDLERESDRATLARGLGRSYGDASLPAKGGVALGTPLADRILGFDAERGILHAEAGLSLHDLTWVVLPLGWSSYIMTGTAYVTLGGMVAADVHGKEHHRDGTFGRHVARLKMRLPSGRVVWTSREELPDLFAAPLGGMGLTGHILEVVVRLRPVPSAWIEQETERFANLDDLLQGLGRAADGWPMTMAWLDCMTRGRAMGRGILYRGRWAPAERAPRNAPRVARRLAVPFDAPGFALNGLSVRLFNEAIYRRHGARTRRAVVSPEAFFHPLDKVLHWNRGYGKRGFTQHQCVVPTRESAGRVLDLVTRLGAASFLCVIKDCGEEGEGLLSFPRPGTSIAIDLPIGPNTRDVVARINRRVIEEGGRIYLAKDTFTTAEDFRAMEGERLERFLEVRRRYDPEGQLASVQSRRLGL